MYPLHWACTEGHLRVVTWVRCKLICQLLNIIYPAQQYWGWLVFPLISPPPYSFLNMGQTLILQINKDVHLCWLQLSMAVQNVLLCLLSVVLILCSWTWMGTQLCIGRCVKRLVACGCWWGIGFALHLIFVSFPFSLTVLYDQWGLINAPPPFLGLQRSHCSDG